MPLCANISVRSYDSILSAVSAGDDSISYTYGLGKIQTSKIINGVTRQTSYSYDLDNRVTGITTGNSGRSYTYDALGRTNRWTTKHGSSTVLTDNFTFAAPSGTNAGSTTGQIASHSISSSGLNATYSYTYDDNGNILSISDGTNTTSYTYDTANQLLRENNQAANKTYVWTYDNAGNILSRTAYAYTTDANPTNPVDTVLYTYGDSDWGDLLTAYDGQTITYDTIGNPLRDGTWNYTWEHGRQLASMTAADGSVNWQYTYSSDGLRSKRTDGTTTYEYIYNGSSLSQMTVGTNVLTFSYDANGFPLSVTYNGTEYYYVTNIQCDVIGILDSAGATVVTYTYDAWGNMLTIEGVLSSTLGKHNPLRYRSYIYDCEIELYYLETRYYNARTNRFLNADTYVSTGQGLIGNNMFAYCGNNPITRIDDCGQGWWIIACTVVGGVVGGVAKVISNVVTRQPWYTGIWGAVVGGCVYGGIISSSGNPILSAYASAASEAVINEVLSYTPMSSMNGTFKKELSMDNVVTSFCDAVNDTVVNGSLLFAAGKIANKIIPTNSGWFKPVKFLSSFLGKYAIKAELQTITQAAIMVILDAVKSGLSKFDSE